MRWLFASLLIGTVAACASGGDDVLVWDKPGAGQGDYQQAAYECERDTRMAARSFGTGVLAEVEARQFAIRCMNSKGFYQRAVGVPPAPSVNQPPRGRASSPEWLAWRARYAECLKQHRVPGSHRLVDECAGKEPPA